MIPTTVVVAFRHVTPDDEAAADWIQRVTARQQTVLWREAIQYSAVRAVSSFAHKTMPDLMHHLSTDSRTAARRGARTPAPHAALLSQLASTIGSYLGQPAPIGKVLAASFHLWVAELRPVGVANYLGTLTTAPPPPYRFTAAPLDGLLSTAAAALWLHGRAGGVPLAIDNLEHVVDPTLMFSRQGDSLTPVSGAAALEELIRVGLARRTGNVWEADLPKTLLAVAR